MQVGLSAYSFPFSCGFLRRIGHPGLSKPLDAYALIDLAVEHGLSGVEIPLTGLLPEPSVEAIDQLRERLTETGLRLVVDTAVIDVEAMQRLLPLAARAGARVVRAMVSTILEGARATIAGGWDAHLHEIRRRIIELRPVLEAHDLVLALENHQDTTSDELIALCEAGGPQVGVTLDVANPLAVAEEPLNFARKLGPLIQNAHLKDYQIYPTPSGFRLVRCTLGEGVIPFAELLPLLQQIAPHASLHIELAAMYARHIRLLEDNWWDGFPARDVRDVLPALRVAALHARPVDESWQTPWELEQSDDQIAAYEREQFINSVAYLRGL